MLHGCGQDAAALAASSGMNRLARAERFLVLYPEQDRLANSQGCWNWFDTRERPRAARGRDHRCRDRAGLHRAAGRPASASRSPGCRPGAGMAALLATQRPERFRGRDALGHRTRASPIRRRRS
jgi:hypothetical protein